MITTDLTIINKLGLHARAAAKLATTANRFGCQVQLHCKGKSIDCKSVMALMMLAASQGTPIQISCNGADETIATEALCTLINNRFDEAE